MQLEISSKCFKPIVKNINILDIVRSSLLNYYTEIEQKIGTETNSEGVKYYLIIVQ